MSDKQKKNTLLHRAWEKLVGSPDAFTLQNRTINALSVITLGVMVCIMLVNVAVGLNVSAYISWIIIILLIAVYYLSRIKRQYQFATGVYAVFTYAGLIINYKYNSGISGPTLFIFFLSFHVLLAITPKRIHLLWALLHVVVVAVLIGMEYTIPNWLPLTYRTAGERYTDVLSTYILCLAFVYIITNYLLNRYNREKKLAEERAQAIETHVKEIEEQNQKLKEIAWLQSHKVRNHVSTIMGLAQLFNEKDLGDAANAEVVKGMINTSAQLDEVIKEINELTKNV